jgi:hypothetical protein
MVPSTQLGPDVSTRPNLDHRSITAVGSIFPLVFAIPVCPYTLQLYLACSHFEGKCHILVCNLFTVTK